MEIITDTRLWQALITTFICYIVLLIFYRLFLHPLARFPGPRLAAVTRYYEAYYDVFLDGQYEFRIAAMHDQYGPIVRISPNELHVKDSSFYEKIFRHEGRWNKYDWAVKGHNAPGSIIFTADHDLHKARRQPLNAFFSKAKVVAHQDLILRHINKLCDRVTQFKGTGRIIDIGAAMSAFQRDVSTELLLGKNYDNLSKDDFDIGMTLFVQAGGKIWRITKHLPWYGPLILSIPKEFVIKHGGDESLANWLRYAIASFPLAIILQHTWQDFLDSENETHRLLKAAANPSEDKGPRTIVHEIAQSTLPLNDKKLQRVFSDVVTITGAGFETTASVLRVIVYNVWSNPNIVERLRSELAQVPLDSKGAMELRSLEKLPYLTGVLMEAMRLSPALGTRLQRIAPDRDLTYQEWRIPAGTPVGMTTLDMHMDPKLYPNPKVFDPERWVDPDARKKREKVYAPFSRGSRICLGMHLAWAELYLVVSTLVQRFDFAFPDIAPDHFEIESDQFIVSTKGKAILKAIVTDPGVFES